MKIGLFYGSDTGRTTAVAEQIKDLIGDQVELDVHDAVDFEKELMEEYQFLIIGLSTWYDGELQSDWESVFDEYCEVDFTGKTVAFYGLGDQVVYCDYFIDGVGIMSEQAKKAGAKLIGLWPTEGYYHSASKAEVVEGTFNGLALDEDTQEELTEERVQAWCKQIMEEFKNA